MTHHAVSTADEIETFTDFVATIQPRLRNALVAVVGPDLAGDAVSEALAYCWQRWDKVRHMENPAGYVWSVGRSKGRDMLRKLGRDRRVQVEWPPVPSASAPLIEPGLPAALTKLSERQRVAVFLVHGYGWTHREVAEFVGVSVPTVQKHAERGLAKLRTALGVGQ